MCSWRPFFLIVSTTFLTSCTLSLCTTKTASLVSTTTRLSTPTVATSLCSACIRLLVVLMASTSPRSEEHTSELQSRENLVCRLLLEIKKILICYIATIHIYYG